MKLGSKYSKLHKCSIAFLVIGCIIAYISIKSIFKSSRETSKSADGFIIESYKVVLNVSENNSIDVKEYITVGFYGLGHHGIYRFIPEWLEYTGKDNNTISRKSKISNLVSYSDNYSVSTVSGKKCIKMGDANRTLPRGYHTYTIGYTYDMGADPYENFDEFIFHAFGDFWGTRINNASVEIHLPKTTNLNNNIHFYADKYRKEDITSYVDYKVYSNMIYASLSPNYSLNNSLTIDLDLPNGYFSNETNNYGSLSLLFCLICIAFAVISFLLWEKNGKDIYKAPETVEFYPPEQLDASQIGYLYKKDTGGKLAIALIVELASKGFIKIIESEKEDFENLKDSISKVSPLYSISRKITIIKSKIEADTINDYSSQDLKHSLGTNEFKGKPKMTENEELVYNQLFKDADETVLSENHSFYEVFTKIEENVRNEFDDKINDLKAYKSMLLSSFGFAVCSLLWGLSYCVIEDLNAKLRFIYLLGAISNIIILVFSILMKRKNSYGEQIKSKINGFKNYIELAEKNQIDMLVEENPNYFYDILPYAYVLDVSKKWIEKFENIPIPTNDMGNFNYCDTNSLDTLSSSVYYPSYSSSSSSGGGCSSCGGGCSSCGGGGSW